MLIGVEEAMIAFRYFFKLYWSINDPAGSNPYPCRVSRYLVGAYPASSAHRSWNPGLEKEFFELLATNAGIGALELPWLGKLHPHDDQWFLGNFPEHLNAVITGIPFVMGQISKNPNYGLASTDEDGRKHAISDVREILNQVNRFNDAVGRNVVSAIEIHTAPRQMGNKNELSRSLEEIVDWNWDSTKINIEHCDAYKTGQNPEKGFLTLQDEILAIQNSQLPIGIFINWGRSAIEFRDATRVVEHIQLAKESGLLRGLIFSGASAKEGLFGYPWIDAHHPFQRNTRHEFGDPDSLLTEELALSALTAAGELDWLGIKMGWPSEVPGSIKQRYQMICAALDVLDAHTI